MPAPAAGAPPAQPKIRVRGLSVLALPRIGVPAAVFPDRRWRNGASYDDIASGSTQFLSRDPLAATTRSPYGYVHGNPLNGTDPSGLFCWNPFSSDCGVDLPGGTCLANGNSHCNNGDTGEANFHDNVQQLNQQYQVGPISLSARDVFCANPFAAGACVAMDADSAAHGESSALSIPLDIAGAIPFGNVAEQGARLFVPGAVSWGARLWNFGLGRDLFNMMEHSGGGLQFFVNLLRKIGVNQFTNPQQVEAGGCG